MKHIELEYVEPASYFPPECLAYFEREDARLSKLRAALLGHAVGDALGVPVEFCSRKALAAQRVSDMVGWGTHPVPAGTWSDDTSMVLATLDSLKGDKIDLEEIMGNFALWVRENKYTATGTLFDIGGSCHAAIERYINGVRPATACGLDGEGANGNGSLMRILPMAMYLHAREYDEKEAIEIIHKTSALTHAHMRSKIACGIFAFIVWELMDSPCEGSILQGLVRAKNFYRQECEAKLFDERLFKRIGRAFYIDEKAENLPMLTEDEIQSTGYVIDTLEAAVWCVLTTNDYKSCVLKAVNLGSDTDTVAAIAGSLAALLRGVDTIPEPWLTTLKSREYIEALAKEAFESWYEATDEE